MSKQRIVLVLQGGGALGAYQAGVFQSLHEAGFEPDWVIGTSIGAINASLIAGNRPEERMLRLEEFWRRMKHDGLAAAFGQIPALGPALANWATVMAGPGRVFYPNPAGAHRPAGAPGRGQPG